MDAFYIIKNARYFIGFFGIMTMVALSNRVNSNFIYISDIEIKTRVIGTPWEDYCKKIVHFREYLKNSTYFLIKSNLIDLYLNFFYKNKYRTKIIYFIKRLIKNITN